MKKLILFLLLPLWAMAQTTTGQEQEFDYGIKNNSTQTITTPPYLTTTGMDGTQGKIPSALIEKTDNKQNSLAVDGTGTKYPTVDAVNSALPKTYATIVYVNTTSPTTATVFDDENPPTVNDDALKTNVANLYIGTDGSKWVYKTSPAGYVTEIVPATSNFNIQFSGGVDAGSDKNSPIERHGSISLIGGSFNTDNAVLVRKNGSDTAQIGGRFSLLNTFSSAGNMFQLNALNGVDLWNYSSGVWNKRFTFSSSGMFTAKKMLIFEENSNTAHTSMLRQELKSSSAVFTGYFEFFLGATNARGGKIVFGELGGGLPESGIDFNLNKTILHQGGDYPLALKTNGSDRITVLGNGNVLIDTSTDTGEKLQVNGGIKATSYTGSATLTGTPTAPTAPVGTTGNQIATLDFVMNNANVGSLEVDFSSKSIWNNGNGNVGTNTSFGEGALASNSTGGNNSAFGQHALAFNANNSNSAFGHAALYVNSSGSDNSAFGNTAMTANTTGSRNLAIGTTSLSKNVSGSNNVAIGHISANHLNDKNTSIGSPNNSVFIGYDSSALYANGTNEIVIGYNANGSGSDTATIGNDNITKTVLKGVISTAKTYTVATLPAGVLGDFTIVSDATAPTYLGTLTGGGSVVCPVFFDGTSWKSH